MRISTINSFMSVRPHGTTNCLVDGYARNLIFEYFWKLCPENWNVIKTHNNNWHLTYKLIYIFDHMALIFFRARNVGGKICIETHVLCSVAFFNLFYEIFWKTFVEPRRTQMKIRRMRISCWIPKVTKHTQIMSYSCFSLQQWLQEGFSTLRYTYIVCFLNIVYICHKMFSPTVHIMQCNVQLHYFLVTLPLHCCYTRQCDSSGRRKH